MKQIDGDCTIVLTAEEAIVLHDLLWRWFDPNSGTSPFTAPLHPAERAVLDDVLTAQLDRQLVAPFDARYGELLVAARAALAARWSFQAED